jgi:hypothetical protein
MTADDKKIKSIEKRVRAKRVRYLCPICKINHWVDFPINLILSSKIFPVNYFIIHKYEGDPSGGHSDADVLIGFFVDQKFHIRGIEGRIISSSGNIMAQTDAEQLITFLTNHIIDLQDNYDEIAEKYQDLLAKTEK